MPRPIWKGHISFGLVNVPVQLHAAENRTDLQLHMVDSRNFARVRYERVNAETGAEVPWNEVVRGYEYSDGNYVVLSDEELKRAAPEATKRIDIEAFVNADDVDQLFFDRPYYLEPGKGGEKGYVLMREALRESNKLGIAKVVIRTRQHIAALMAKDDVLVLNLLRYAQEIRSPDKLNIPRGSLKSHKVTPQELKIARTLVESMTTEWDPEQYQDEYRGALMKWIEKKIESGEIHEPMEGPEVEEIEAPAPIDFMRLLKESVQHVGAAHTNGHDGHPARNGHRDGRAHAARTKKKASKATHKRASARTAKTTRRRKAG
jgi:DNA end-binding protein Ku